MDQASNRQKIIAGALSAVLWLAAIIAMHFFSDVKDALLVFTATCQSIILLITGAHMNAAAGSNKQGGFGKIPMIGLVAALAIGATLLGGCTTTTASMYSGIYTQAKAGVQVFDDNTLTTMRDLLCAQPYSAIQRHPEMQAAIQQLCGPLANAATLDAGQLQLLMSVVGKAQAAGLLAVLPAASASSPK